MTTFILSRGEPHVALSHLALYGLSAILEEAGHDVRLSWTTQLRSRPCLTGPDLNDETVGAAVQEHVVHHADAASWVNRDIMLKGTKRGLMSPRLAAFGDRETWQQVQLARHDVLDLLTDRQRRLDLRMLAALGEPAYWSSNAKQFLQDDGASRWEMQPRNQGSEIVRNRLHGLATAIAARKSAAIAAGLQGLSVRDEIGNDRVDSRTATGLAAPGPTDNAVAWCALWGISQLPIAARTSTGQRAGTAITSGHIGRPHNEWFYAPIWHQRWRPAKLRSLLASAQLRTAASSELLLSERDMPTALAVESARRWLTARGVVGMIRFPIARFGSDNAPERRAMRGELVAVRT